MDELDVGQPSVSFDLKASADLTDLSDSYWTGSVKLLKQTNGSWEKIGTNDKVAPVDNFFYSLWADQFIKLNGTEIQSNHQLFWLQCYLTLLSSIGKESADRWKLAGYYGDTRLVRIEKKKN